MSKEQFIVVDKVVQNAIETGDWGGTGVAPKKNCKHCMETGKEGYNIGQQRYVACRCVNIRWPEILAFVEKEGKSE